MEVNMEHKTFQSFVTKVDEAKGIVEHLVAVMGNKDQGNDVIWPGAFTKTLSERGNKVKVLDLHKTDSIMRVLGKPISLREIGAVELSADVKTKYPDAVGALAATTQFNLKTTEGLGAFERIKAGDIDEWSFGYDAIGPDYGKAADGSTVRNLREVRLYEYSPVIFGMNAATTTLSAKSDEGGQPTEGKPWQVFHEGDKWRVYKLDADGQPTGDPLGEFDTEEEARAQQQALYANEPQANGKAAVMKTEEDGDHPASHYLVVEDPEKVTTWHLRVRDVGGKPDHGLMGAAWSELHGGYRGQAYEGPGKQTAISKLTAMYAAENMDTPKSDEKSGRRLKGDMVALIAEMQATLDKLAQWANYQDGEGGTPPTADGAPAEGQAAKTAGNAQAGPSNVTPTSKDALRQMIEIELEQLEVE
jgi:HK97 family phage prohead protease